MPDSAAGALRSSPSAHLTGIAVALGLCIVPLPPAAAAPAGEPPPLAAPVATGLPPMQQLMADAERLRGRSFLRSVEWELITSERLHELFAESQMDREQITLGEKVLKKFGLIPDDLDLYETLLALLGEQVGGFYDPKVHKLFALNADSVFSARAFGPEAASLEVNHTLVHELTHALQDQHFDLAAFIDEEALARGDVLDDQIMARLALVEGDAMMVGLEHTIQSVTGGGPGLTAMAIPPQVLDQLLAAAGTADIPGMDQLGQAPPYLRKSLYFPYLSGFRFVMALRRAGGWAGVDAAYARIPESSEQILHVDRYFTPDHPTPVPAVEIADVLDPAWRPERPANLGELDIQLLLEEYLGAEAGAPASAGWDGDRVALFSHEQTGEVLAVWTSVWDSQAEAREFAEAYRTVLAQRYGVGATANGIWRWDTAAGQVSLERRGPWVLVIDALPPDEATAVAARTWDAVRGIRPTP